MSEHIKCLTSVIRKSRRFYRCTFCSRSILVGERYCDERAYVIDNNRWERQTVHLSCSNTTHTPEQGYCHKDELGCHSDSWWSGGECEKCGHKHQKLTEVQP